MYLHFKSYRVQTKTKIEPIDEPKPSSNTSVDNVSTAHSQVRLPKIEFPKFTGDLASWTSFISLFDTTIHNNNSSPDVMKFQYLQSVLDKEPLNLIYTALEWEIHDSYSFLVAVLLRKMDVELSKQFEQFFVLHPHQQNIRYWL